MPHIYFSYTSFAFYNLVTILEDPSYGGTSDEISSDRTGKQGMAAIVRLVGSLSQKYRRSAYGPRWYQWDTNWSMLWRHDRACARITQASRRVAFANRISGKNFLLGYFQESGIHCIHEIKPRPIASPQTMHLLSWIIMVACAESVSAAKIPKPILPDRIMIRLVSAGCVVLRLLHTAISCSAAVLIIQSTSHFTSFSLAVCCLFFTKSLSEGPLDS